MPIEKMTQEIEELKQDVATLAEHCRSLAHVTDRRLEKVTQDIEEMNRFAESVGGLTNVTGRRFEQLTQEIEELNRFVKTLGMNTSGCHAIDMALAGILTASVISLVMSSESSKALFKCALEGQIEIYRPKLDIEELPYFDVHISNIRGWIDGLG